ncbi:MAG: ATP-binding protein [Gammaproteobacteria bacterium]
MPVADPGGRVAQLRWQPLSLMGVLGRSDYAGLVTAVIWFAVIAVCVWWAIVGYRFSWNLWPIELFNTPVVFGFYLPWSVCVLLVMWFGLEWAALPAYLATLFGALHANMPLDLAVVNALHNPLAMGVYFLFYCWLPYDYSLRNRKSWLIFISASLIAAMVSSIGAFISQYNVVPASTALWSSWLGWWPNAFLQSILIDAPLIYLLSPFMEKLKQRYFPHTPTEPFSMLKLLLAVSMFLLCLALFILLDDRWQDTRANLILAAPLPDGLREQIQAHFNLQHFVIWVLALLLAAVSLGGAIIASRWIRRLREVADSQTHVVREALQHSEARFRHFFENNPVPMWVCDPDDGRFLETNLVATRRYGYSRQEFLGMTISDVYPPEEVERLRKLKSQNVTNAFLQAGEWRHRCKDGSHLDVEMDINPIKMDGRVVYLAVAHDLSSHRQAQAAMEQRARELRILAAASLEITSAQTMAQIFQTSVERARQLIGANVAMVHNWEHVAPDGIDGRVSLAPEYVNWADFKVTPDDGGIYKAVLQGSRALRLTRKQLQQHPQFRSFGRDQGMQPPLKGMLAVALTTDGTATGVLMVSDKITGDFDAQDEILLTQLAQVASAGLDNVRLSDALRHHMHDLEQRVAERTADLDASNRELDAFAYSAAHDLRAPLRAMHGFADAILEDYGSRLDEAGRNYLARIVKASQNMDALIRDLLAYSRLGRKQITLEGVSLNEVIKEVLADLAAEIEMRHASISLEVPAMQVEAHRGTLKQVILNLVSNAIKFVAPEKRPEVRIQASARDGRVILSVSDNGIGIAPGHRERIFNVFERLHGAETYPGTGIGLSIVKKGLARMHGEIHVESGENGSLFQANLREFIRE